VPRYDSDAIRHLISEAQRHSGGMGKLGEDLPQNDDDKAFGEMRTSKDVHDGLNDFVGSMSQQFSHAEKLLDDVSRSLDGALRLLDEQEAENVTALTPDDIGLQ